MIPIAAFANRADAVAVSSRAYYGVQGIATDFFVSEYPVYASVSDFDANEREELRQKALAKLSQEERAALGVS